MHYNKCERQIREKHQAKQSSRLTTEHYLKKKKNSWSNANYPNVPRFPCSELIWRVNSLFMQTFKEPCVHEQKYKGELIP